MDKCTWFYKRLQSRGFESSDGAKLPPWDWGKLEASILSAL